MDTGIIGSHQGTIYHVMNRGDRKEDIFVDDPDRQRFVKIEGGREKGANGCGLAGRDDDVALDCGAAADGALTDGGRCRAESRVGPTEVIQVKYSIGHL